MIKRLRDELKQGEGRRHSVVELVCYGPSEDSSGEDYLRLLGLTLEKVTADNGGTRCVRDIGFITSTL